MDHLRQNGDEFTFDLPHLINQPPQIFGNYGPDGSPIPSTLNGALFGDQDLLSMDDVNDPKRRRIARACDMCRKKKIKCDGKMPKCSHCINYKTECVFTQVEKKRNPPKGAKYIEGLENRLGRMESLLKLSGLLSEEDAGKTDLASLEKRLADRSNSISGLSQKDGRPSTSGMTSQRASESFVTTPPQDTHSSPHTSVTSPDPPKEEKTEEVEQLSDMMCSLVTNNCGETRYIGSSSGFSIFSPKGIQWVNEKTGDSSFQEMISSSSVDDNKWVYWKPEIFSDLFVRRIFKSLPPKDECLSLMKDFFENFNCMFPIFHEPTFMHLVEKQYSRDPYEGSGWWASINVALAIAHRLRVMSNLVPQDEDQKAWMYLKNAMGVLTELTMRNTDLLSVQALLGMSIFLQGTPNPQPSFFLVAAAIRLSHSIGLHKRGSAFNLNPIEAEQRKRVFWIAYMLDKDICLRSGRPPVQDDDDMNVELPSEDPPDNIGNIPLASGKGKTNLFRLMCTFAIISSNVYKRLYSVKAARQTDGELLNTIGELDKELEDWKDGIPLDFRPEHEIKASHTPLILHVVVLHFSYYNCLTTIHRMSVHHGYWTSRLSNYAIQGLNARPLNPRIFSSAALCVAAARASIHLIKYIPQGDFACVWMVLYFPVSALVTLFANILQNPLDSRARGDIKLMNLVVNFLSMLASDEGNGSVKRMLAVCSEFERIANVVLDKADKDNHPKRKRKPDASVNDPATAALAQQINGHAHANSEDGSTPMNRGQSQATNGQTPSASAAATFSPQFAAATPPSAGNPYSTIGNVYSPPPGLLGSDIPMSMLSGSDFNPSDPSASLNDILKNNGSPPPQRNGLPSGYSDQNGHAHNIASNGASSLNPGSFQQPFVPQDLWQMPMTLEWDWADMTMGNGGPGGPFSGLGLGDDGLGGGGGMS